jgi:hypothetical protein
LKTTLMGTVVRSTNMWVRTTYVRPVL